MHFSLTHPIDRPAVGILGTWDPFLHKYETLLQELVAHAHSRDWAAVPLVIDPPPPMFLDRKEPWPVCHDLASRLEFLMSTGVDSVGVIAFEATDLGRSAGEFFGMVAEQVKLVEFWLKPGQTIGRRGPGSVIAIQVQGLKRGWHLRHLPAENEQAENSFKVRRMLAGGHVSGAITVLGRPPIFRRPADGTVQLGWAPGWYRANRIQNPIRPVAESSSFDIDVFPGPEGTSSFSWPDQRADYIAFETGPADSVLAPA